MSADNYPARILARQQMGCGQRKFAKILGVGRTCVANWEHERRRPHERYQQKLEEVLRRSEDGQTRSDSHS